MLKISKLDLESGLGINITTLFWHLLSLQIVHAPDTKYMSYRKT